MPDNLCYAQSGGVTAVINTTAAAVIAAAAAEPAVGRVFAAKNGVLG
ncbi:MAG: diphosphate--fructose-6-phosphate 1-phosphotransferase, partial [Betaproteobacteria bacterium]|nr:diphosphate--fructose-6-phosphate 1-phosphotransferase [Betaproteobacteria bacterium]